MSRVCRGCSDCAMGGSGTTCVPGNYGQDWRSNMAAALLARNCTHQTEWVERFPGEHCWFDFWDTPSCANCGAVRKCDDSNKPCRGIVEIAPRSKP